MHTYKEDLALNNLQWLICHKTNERTNERTKQTNNKKVYTLHYLHSNYNYQFLQITN